MTRQNQTKKSLSRGANPSLVFHPTGDEFFVTIYCDGATDESEHRREYVTAFHSLSPASGWVEYEGLLERRARGGGGVAPNRPRARVLIGLDNEAVGAESESARKNYNLACSQCDTRPITRRHENLTPILDGLRALGVSEFALRRLRS